MGIDVLDATKIFKDRGTEIHAVDHVEFSVPKGEITALIGENGAGKTTLLRMISTLLEPTSGNITVSGHHTVRNAMEVKKKIGVLFGGEMGLYDRLTARENLQYFAALYGMTTKETNDRIEFISVRLGMKNYLDRLVSGFSRGMRQKVAIARTLIHDPDILLFDEPTTGLDITAANIFRELIHQLRKEGKTIIFSSHMMEEVKMLCQSILIIHKGKLVYQGYLKDLFEEEESDDLNYIFMSHLVRADE